MFKQISQLLNQIKLSIFNSKKQNELDFYYNCNELSHTNYIKIIDSKNTTLLLKK